MKKLLVVLISGVLVLSFTSCKKDGVYRPGKKISQIYTESPVYEEVYNEDEDYYDEVPTGETILTLSQNWLWNGNLLEEKEIYDGLEITGRYFFTYEKNRLIRVMKTWKEPIEYSGQYAYVYDKNKLDKIVIDDYDGGSEMNFVYDKNTLKEVNIFYDNDYDRSISPAEILEPLAMVLDNNVFASLEANEAFVADLTENISKSQKSLQNIKITFEWTKKNISKMTITSSNFPVTYDVTFSYDKKVNPFCGLLFTEALEAVSYAPTASSSNVLMFSANNVTEMKMLASAPGHSSSSTTTISYEYDGNYPTKITAKYSSDDMLIEGGAAAATEHVEYIHYK